MIVLLRDRSGEEYQLGVAGGVYVDAAAVSGPIHDLRHLIALPGLADCHAHLSGNDVSDMIEYDGSDLIAKMTANANRQLEAGALLLAEKGSKSALTLRFLGVAEDLRPRMQMAGRMIAAPGGYYPGFAAEIDDDELEVKVRAATSGGATWVKIVGDWPRQGQGPLANFSQDSLERIVAIAHAAGCRVAIHTTAPQTPQLAVRAGVDSIEHGLFLDEDDLIALGDRRGAWVPTVSAMEAVAAWLGPGSSGGRMLGEGLDNVAALLGLGLEAGVVVLAGTDLALPHGQVAAEAIRLIDYGLSAEQAVRAVSDAAYNYLGFERGFAVGLPADVVAFDGDPAADPTLLLDPALVMRAGVIITGL